MGKAAARMVSQQLIAAGLPRDTPAIVVENASLPNEHIVRTRLHLLEIATAATLRDGPAVLLIGRAFAGQGNAAGNTLCSLLETEGSLPQFSA